MPNSTVSWLVAGAPGASRAEHALALLCEKLRDEGIDVARAAVLVSTPHPNVHGRRCVWEAGEAVEVTDAPLDVTAQAVYIHSPVQDVIDSRASLRRRLKLADDLARYPLLVTLRDRGFTDYLALPLRFTDDEVHVASFATRAAAGFTPAAAAALEPLADPLARIAEIFALRRVADNIVTAYLGRRAGRQVLLGSIHRGDVELIDCAVLISDVVSYTVLYAELPAEEIVERLNAYFDVVCDAVARRGGEVLKFIGDSVLAIFPAAPGNRRTSCRAAFDAALASTDALYATSTSARPLFEHRVGIDFGSVHFGNIGASDRLDFTVVGQHVNTAARLCALRGRGLGVTRLSAAAAEALDGAVVLAGRFTLKGVGSDVPVFVPADPAPAGTSA